jgi:hypothetical protein
MSAHPCPPPDAWWLPRNAEESPPGVPPEGRDDDWQREGLWAEALDQFDRALTAFGGGR